MTFRKKTSSIFALVIFLLMTNSCSTLEVHHTSGKRIGHGPPVHARAHGYHRKQVAGVELTYDSALCLYVVVGYPDYYYNDGYFYRFRDATWEMSTQPNKGWICVSEKSLPPGLLAKGKKKYKKAS